MRKKLKTQENNNGMIILIIASIILLGFIVFGFLGIVFDYINRDKFTVLKEECVNKTTLELSVGCMRGCDTAVKMIYGEFDVVNNWSLFKLSFDCWKNCDGTKQKCEKVEKTKEELKKEFELHGFIFSNGFEFNKEFLDENCECIDINQPCEDLRCKKGGKCVEYKCFEDYFVEVK